MFASFKKSAVKFIVTFSKQFSVCATRRSQKSWHMFRLITRIVQNVTVDIHNILQLAILSTKPE